MRFDLRIWRIEDAAYTSLDLRNALFSHWIISYVWQGKVTTETAGIRNVVNAGDVMIHPPQIPFSEFADGYGRHLWLLFDASAPDGSSVDLLTQFPLPPVISLRQYGEPFVRTFRELLAVSDALAGTSDLLTTIGLTAHLFRYVIAAWEEAGKPPRPESFQTTRDRFADVVRCMETRLSERLTREDLAGLAFLHPGSFDRAFRAAHGVPPMRMLQEMRLNKARYLLETTQDTLDAVAYSCGLGDSPRLSRLFRARFGIPPGTYRNSVKETRQRYILPLSDDAPTSYNETVSSTISEGASETE
jgi:AraC-like DNA-binding protein